MSYAEEEVAADEVVDEAAVQEESPSGGSCEEEIRVPYLRLSMVSGGGAGLYSALVDPTDDVVVANSNPDELDEVFWNFSARDEKSVGYVSSFAYSQFEDNGIAFYGANQGSVSRAEILSVFLKHFEDIVEENPNLGSQTIVIRRTHHIDNQKGTTLTHSDLELMQSIRLILEFFKFSKWKVQIEVLSKTEEGELTKEVLSYVKYMSAERGDYPVDVGLLEWMRKTGDSMIEDDQKPSKLELLKRLVRDIEHVIETPEKLERAEKKEEEPAATIIIEDSTQEKDEESSEA
ncbi:MAG: hypothetical protein AAF202_09395 [Pseudomonadota bacterium]